MQCAYLSTLVSSLLLAFIKIVEMNNVMITDDFIIVNKAAFLQAVSNIFQKW